MAVELLEAPAAKKIKMAFALDETPDRLEERPCPLFFLVAPSFVGALIWLWAMLSYMPR